MMNTMVNEIKVVLAHLNQVTGEDFLALQTFETGIDDAVAIIFVAKKNDKGFENAQLSFNRDENLQFFSVDNDRNIVDITPDVQLVMFHNDLQGLKENIEKYGIEKGIQVTKDNGILTSEIFE